MMTATNENFSQLYKKYINSLYRFGMGMGLSHDACLDIIHDVFCKLIEKNKVFDADSIKHYLFRSFINRHHDIQKSKGKISGSIDELPFAIEVSLDDTATAGYDIEQEEMTALKQKVEFLLGILTQRQRKAVYLRYMEAMEYEEIGKLMDMNTESVRKLVFRGLEKLRKHAGSVPMYCLLSILFRTTHIG